MLLLKKNTPFSHLKTEHTSFFLLLFYKTVIRTFWEGDALFFSGLMHALALSHLHMYPRTEASVSAAAIGVQHGGKGRCIIGSKPEKLNVQCLAGGRGS